MKSDLEETLLRHIGIIGLPTPDREFRFHPTRKWRFDFAWPALFLAVECEGGTWNNGAHGRGKHMASDMTKYNEAALLGWTVLRFDNHMINDGEAVEVIERALAQEGAK